MDLRRLNGGGGGGSSDHSSAEWSTEEWVLRMCAIVLLLSLAAIFSGLTLGLMALDKNGLQIVIEAGEEAHATEQEKANAQNARKIQRVRRDGHLLLATLLFGNVAVNSVLAIIMADMTSGTLGFLLTTFLLVVFGELIPQALCSRHALYIGAKSLPIVWFFIYLMYIITKPIALTLDWMLGHEIGTIFNKRELGKMLEIYVKHNMLDADETDIMKGAMHYKKKTVASVMTPIENVYTLPGSTKLTQATIRDIYHQGFSRIPVWGKNIHDIVGIIFVKDLIFADPAEETTLLHFVHVFGRGVHRVWPDSTLGEVLQAFKMGRTHLALVHDVNNAGPGDPFYQTKGVVTLEDIVEEILQAEIYDESDAIDAETHRKNRLSNRSYDAGVSHVLEGSEKTKLLATPEAEALAKHLVAHEPVFMTSNYQGTPLDESQVAAILAKSHIVEYDARADDVAHAELYTEGKVANFCMVVLAGYVMVSSGAASPTKGGLWSVFGADSLLAADGSYESDVTVEIPPDVHVRCLRIPRLEFQSTLFPMHIVEKPTMLAERRLDLQNSKKDLGAADVVLDVATPTANFQSDMDATQVPYHLSTRESM
ncbi:hypothetical protein H310_06515 [Aphanomyces invadans]|uniref:CNNM transmembrane domain-containing protein n=1 Tax=Aphanomyces invadans TaxID=157072 RepID=A0A024U7Y9_9STRA|nr:hypothetical protein H310_06515 [Aphanomyces invadans]ETW01997.1 hypothetical protein H310_06515 [Aphanomyces invadans]|eukprot:XP_008869845.1 hypothetical protein H310_06515 [Aphanomyces invadans]